MKIAIVDGYSTGSILVNKLRERGVECVHLRSQEAPPARLLPSFVPDYYAADLGWFPDLDDAVRGRGFEAFLHDLPAHRLREESLARWRDLL
ncbi:hypothetical protein [Streptomyces iakyrus]|uniref:hypothetical protein n=1 Tax=Streptomyces iakyrus TaxID=68219 RepID=UPI0036FBA60F